ncbi:hypothetical protein EVJ58_g6032 [Rhodofomes roseus]|uniref:DUF6535 domain-containing protein n=2 Tax=Rhodofomes roseus TaxID=34475 RepID=A0A4Y9YBB7_9APHY|nr:hypothetical protein EVJ58_g6032 [Rhodofomes roseus]
MDSSEEPSGRSSILPNRGIGKNNPTPVPNDHVPSSPNIAVGAASSSKGDGSVPCVFNPVGSGTAGPSSSPSDTTPAALNERGSKKRSDTSGAKHSPESADHSAKDVTTPPETLETILTNVFEKYMKPRDPQKEEDAWPVIAQKVWSYEKDRLDRWRNEINTLLVFAGLFSAVLTGFVGPYYAVLLPPPDFNTIILERISAQLGNMSSNPAIVPGSSSPSFPPGPPAPRWIATLWFASLVFSLGAASVALAVNQWLNFHAEQWGLLTIQQKVRTWQLRRDSLNKWNVEFIVSLLPCLLQVALILFLVGMVGYLWVLGPDISVLSTVVVGVLLLFLASTSVLPALVPYSPYKSPQAWWICQACRGMTWGVCSFLLQVHHAIIFLCKIRPPDFWSSPRAVHIYKWTEKVRVPLAQCRNLARTLMKKRDWLAHEQACLDGSEEKALFSDIYTIAQGLDVLRAMATCARAMPIAQAVKNVTDIGQLVAAALSKRQHSRSSRSTPGDHLPSDDLGSTATALIGRMVAETFTRAQTEREDDLNLDPIRRVYIGITVAMPVADGIDACMLLFRCLNRPDGAEPETAVSGGESGLRQRRGGRITCAVEDVTAMGEALFGLLSNQQYSQSRTSEPSSSKSGHSLQRDDSVGTAIARIGRMVLDTFLRAQTELDDDTHALNSDYHRMLAGVIRAMPLADGHRACMSLFRHLLDGRLSTNSRRATLDVIQNVYVTIDFLAEDEEYDHRGEMQTIRRFECAPHAELYRLHDVRGKSTIRLSHYWCKLKFGIDWECVQTALTTVYARRDPVSTIQITTTILAICLLSVENEHTLPAEPSRGAYLADMVHQFDEHLATLRRKELRDTVQDLPAAAIYRLDWVLNHMTGLWDIPNPLVTTEIGWNVMMSTNRIARRLQWLLEYDLWTPRGTVQGFNIPLQAYAVWARWCLECRGIDATGLNLDGSLQCALGEPQSEDDRSVDSREATSPEPTVAGDERARDPPAEPRTDGPKRSITQNLVDAVHRPACRRRASDIEMQAVGAGSESNAAPDAPGATNAAPPAVSGATPAVATTLDESESPQGPDAAQAESVHPLGYTEPHADDSDAARAVAATGTSADEGRQDGLAGAIERADGRQGSDAHSSLEGLAAPGGIPTRPSASHQELGNAYPSPTPYGPPRVPNMLAGPHHIPHHVTPSFPSAVSPPSHYPLNNFPYGAGTSTRHAPSQFNSPAPSTRPGLPLPIPPPYWPHNSNAGPSHAPSPPAAAPSTSFTFQCQLTTENVLEVREQARQRARGARGARAAARARRGGNPG